MSGMKSIETRLAQIGCSLLHSKKDRSGVTIHLIKTSESQSVAMLESDVAELINGQTTVDEIGQRHRAKDMEPPWPSTVGPLTSH